MKKAILRIQCPDREGLIHEITGFIARHNGNVLELEQFVDQNNSVFFMRVVWDMTGFMIPFSDFGSSFLLIQRQLNATYWINDSDKKDRMAVFVSKELHCLGELLLQWHMGNLPVDIPLIIGNHENGRGLAKKFGIEFVHTPADGRERSEVEKLQLGHLARHKIDLIALARYMRIFTGEFVNQYPDRIINVHHSFLPAFAGTDPYRQAYDRGVKIIGATSHFVTRELDQGPIIAQDTTEIHHGYSVALLRKVGQEIEKKVFIKAIQKHLERKIIRHGNRTIVFE
jgi:formyltetrahydrofolate deformylase